MRYHVLHHNAFKYQSPVISAQHLVRLKPREIENQQRVLKHQMSFSEIDLESIELMDYFGNTLHELRLQTRHKQLDIRTSAEIEVKPREDILLELSPAWEDVAAVLALPGNAEQWQATQFCFPSVHVEPDGVDNRFATIFSPGKPILRLALELTQFIFAHFTYKGGVTGISTPVAEILRLQQGVCQDFAHVAIAALRRHGLAARYVSGYILSQLGERPALVGAEASHAWISVFCPGLGWIDYDPTNNQMTSDQHIVLAWGRDYADVAPTRGSILGGGTQSLDVDVRVTALD